MTELLVDGELILYGAVGENFFEQGFTAREVVNALASVRGKDVTVRINSGGGYSDEGVAIYNALVNHGNKITVMIDGIAASAASLIAMAGSKIVMRTGSVMMVHDPMMICMGNASDMAKSIEHLDAAANSMADLYATRTGRPAAEIRAEMRDELWLTPDEAVAKGYATSTADDAAIEASAFDYRAYARTPERIVALSDARAWSNRLKRLTAATPKTKETQQMADTMTKEAAAALAETAATDATKAEQDRGVEIVEACISAEAPAMAAKLIRDGVTVEQAKARLDGAKDIRAAVTLARKSCPTIDAALADQFIASGCSLEKVRADLFEKIAATQAARPTRSQHQATTGADDLDAKATDDAWARQVNKVNARAKSRAA